MDTIEEVSFKCEACGRSFPPLPDMVRPTWISLKVPPGQEDDLNLLEEIGETKAFLEYADPEEIEEAGFTQEERRRLLAGEDVEKGTIILCLECQDSGGGCRNPECPCNQE